MQINYSIIELLEEVCSYLDKSNIDYMISGSMALLNRFEAWVISPKDLILSKLMWIQQLESKKDILKN